MDCCFDVMQFNLPTHNNIASRNRIVNQHNTWIQLAYLYQHDPIYSSNFIEVFEKWFGIDANETFKIGMKHKSINKTKMGSCCSSGKQEQEGVDVCYWSIFLLIHILYPMSAPSSLYLSLMKHMYYY